MQIFKNISVVQKGVMGLKSSCLLTLYSIASFLSSEIHMVNSLSDSFRKQLCLCQQYVCISTHCSTSFLLHLHNDLSCVHVPVKQSSVVGHIVVLQYKPHECIHMLVNLCAYINEVYS